MFKNVNILEFGDDIQIHHEKCIEISTNMPSIGSEIPEITFEISELLSELNSFCMTNLMAVCQVLMATGNTKASRDGRDLFLPLRRVGNTKIKSGINVLILCLVLHCTCTWIPYQCQDGSDYIEYNFLLHIFV